MTDNCMDRPTIDASGGGVVNTGSGTQQANTGDDAEGHMQWQKKKCECSGNEGDTGGTVSCCCRGNGGTVCCAAAEHGLVPHINKAMTPAREALLNPGSTS